MSLSQKLGRLGSAVRDVASTAAKQVGHATRQAVEHAARHMGVESGRVVSVGRYTVRLKNVLGEGGYSFVYVCRETLSDQQFALKRILVHDEESLTRAQNEVNVLQEIGQHRHISALLDSQTVQTKTKGTSEVFLLFEMLEGGSLVDYLNGRRGAPLAESEVLDIFHQVCLAVRCLHDRQPPIAHRDMKAENILSDGRGTWKLIDFGSCTTRAKMYETRKEIIEEEEEISRFSTMMYRAPEMVDLYQKKLINEKVDIWALGCILYTLMYLTHPFDDNSRLGIMNAQYTVPPSDFSKDLVDLVPFLMVPDPEKRPDIFQTLGYVDKMRGMPTPPPRRRDSRVGSPPCMAEIHTSQPELQRRKSIEFSHWNTGVFHSPSDTDLSAGKHNQPTSHPPMDTKEQGPDSPLQAPKARPKSTTAKATIEPIKPPPPLPPGRHTRQKSRELRGGTLSDTLKSVLEWHEDDGSQKHLSTNKPDANANEEVLDIPNVAKPTTPKTPKARTPKSEKPHGIVRAQTNPVFSLADDDAVPCVRPPPPSTKTTRSKPHGPSGEGSGPGHHRRSRSDELNAMVESGILRTTPPMEHVMPLHSAPPTPPREPTPPKREDILNTGPSDPFAQGVWPSPPVTTATGRPLALDAPIPSMAGHVLKPSQRGRQDPTGSKPPPAKKESRTMEEMLQNWSI